MQMNIGDEDFIREKILSYLYNAYRAWDLSAAFGGTITS